ncbi:MAG TPA: hypothetical protein VH230_15775 [Stellaceae bacterium]|jgi:hypothetical protein|nr:hypothetical protein [Stellaceae bacterium]
MLYLPASEQNYETVNVADLQDEQPPAAPPLECEPTDRDGSPGTSDDFGRIMAGP